MQAAPASAATPRILLVEDDQGFLHALEMILRNAGFDVIGVSNYGPALEQLEGSERIDLLLTDIVMQDGVNGLALSRMARMRRPELNVMYMSAYDIPGVDGAALGPVLRKPFEQDELLVTIRLALAGPGAGPGPGESTHQDAGHLTYRVV